MRKLTPLLLACLLLACGKDNEHPSNLNMLVAGKWDLSGVIIPGNNSTDVNLFDSPACPECLKDDQIEISSNGRYEISLGDDLCESNTQIFKFEHIGTWKFTQSEDSIMLNPDSPEPVMMRISSLSENELRLTYRDTIPQIIFKNDSAVYPITILYTREPTHK